MDDMPPDSASTGTPGAMLIDLTPGAITAATMEGETEQFDTIGDLLQYLLDKFRMAETGSVTHGDFLAGYGEDGTAPQRMPTESDSASARRA